MDIELSFYFSSSSSFITYREDMFGGHDTDMETSLSMTFIVSFSCLLACMLRWSVGVCT